MIFVQEIQSNYLRAKIVVMYKGILSITDIKTWKFDKTIFLN